MPSRLLRIGSRWATSSASTRQTTTSLPSVNREGVYGGLGTESLFESSLQLTPLPFRENLDGKLGVAEVLDHALVARPYLRVKRSPNWFVTLPRSTPGKLMAHRSLDLRQQQLRPNSGTQRASREAGIFAAGLRVRLGFAKHLTDVDQGWGTA